LALETAFTTISSDTYPKPEIYFAADRRFGADSALFACL